MKCSRFFARFGSLLFLCHLLYVMRRDKLIEEFDFLEFAGLMPQASRCFIPILASELHCLGVSLM